MQTATGTPRTEAPVREDALFRIARSFYFVGALCIPFLVLRVVGDNVTASDIAFGIAGLLLAISRHNRPPVRMGLAFVFFLVVAGGLTAAFGAVDFNQSVLATGRMAFIVAIWPWMTRALLTSRAHVERAVHLWAIGAVIFGIVSVIQTQLPTFLAYGGEEQTSGRVLGLAGHPTDAGGVLCIALPVVIALVLDRHGRRRLGWLLGLGFIAIGLVLAASVSSFIAGALGVLVLAFRLRARIRTIVLTAIGGYIAIQIAISQQAQNLALSPLERFRATTSGQYDTAQYRLETDAFAWDKIQQNPFLGVGLDSASGTTVMGLQTHNLFLGSWFQGGLLFVVGLMIFGLMAAHQAFKRTPLVDPLRAMLAGSFTAAVMFAMTSPLLAQRYLWFPIVLLLALPNRSETERIKPPSGA